MEAVPVKVRDDTRNNRPPAGSVNAASTPDEAGVLGLMKTNPVITSAVTPSINRMSVQVPSVTTSAGPVGMI